MNLERLENGENVNAKACGIEAAIGGENGFSQNAIAEEEITDGFDESESDEISFADLGLDEKTLAAVERKGFKTPSPIQTLAIPRLLNGDANIIARARTGTGKTAAFGLPIIQNIRDCEGAVKALILEPTRELAIQTCTEMQSFTDGKTPRTCVLYGGASYATQIRELRRGAEIVVGTPGRIQDHLERGTLDIGKIDYFILDEGDEMLDMGFIDDIEAIFEQANPDSRILLFSATMPEPILKIAGKFMGDYEIVEEEGVIDEPLLIDQKFWVLRENEKIDALVRLIDIADDFYGLVFTQTKNDADFVNRLLDEKGYQSAALHGDIAQSQREKILARFRSKKTRVLVATDVAARGIDITGLSHVVNYSMPFDGATYVHRIGRTGRAGSTGIAVTFVAPNERRKLGFLQRAVRKASKGEMKEESIPSIEEVLAKKRERLFAGLKTKLGLAPAAGDTLRAVTNETGTDAENLIFSDPAISGCEEEKTLIKKGDPVFEAMAKELCAYDDAQTMLASVLAVIYGEQLDKARYGRIQAQGGASDQTRLYVQLGRRDGYNPRAVAEFFSDLLHIQGRDVDRIAMSANFTLVSLPKEAAKRALELSKRADIPHMHVDTKEFDGMGGGKRRRSDNAAGSFNGGGRGFRRQAARRGGFERGDGFGGKSERGFRNKGSRPNFHTPTERSGRASLYKKDGRAERF
ncbi:MAG: DEAD/DEAH box helicase [Treponema sp.]